MKRIVEPSPSRTIVLGEEAVASPDTSAIQPPEPSGTAPAEIPPKNLFHSDLKQLNGYREMRKKLKLNNEMLQFVQETQKVLSLFDSKDKHYDAKTVQFVSECAEHFFVSHPKMGDIKERAVIETCKQFYNNDEELVKSIISLILPFIKKSTMLRRIKYRLSNFLWVAIAFLLGTK